MRLVGAEIAEVAAPAAAKAARSASAEAGAAEESPAALGANGLDSVPDAVGIDAGERRKLPGLPTRMWWIPSGSFIRTVVRPMNLRVMLSCR